MLKTKLHRPTSFQAHLVTRERLFASLDAGTVRKMTLISAPAGYGKTTLLSSWIQRQDKPSAWLSLDANDDDPLRFWSYYIAALQTVDEHLGRALIPAIQAPQPPPLQAIITDLLNALDDFSAPLILVLDDYHHIQSQAIHQDVAYLLENAPGHFHLILATRSDPPIPLARLRGSGELLELRQADLCFSAAEAALFLNEAMALDLSPEDVAALESRTEGWIAGLQLAALSLSRRPDKRAFIAKFAGDDRFIADYLLEEVLEHQPPTIQAFLLSTSILEELCPSLCDAVTGQADGRETLRYLERANLFIVSLDGQREWFRYHGLFSELLRQRLRRSTSKEAQRQLYRRASSWYAGHDLPHDAVRCSLAAADFERAAQLVEQEAVTLVNHGQVTTLLAWLDALPAEQIQRRPWIGIARAWLLLYAGQPEAIESLLQSVENHLPGSHTPETDRIRGYCAALRAGAAAFVGDGEQEASYTRQALGYLSEQDVSMRCLCGALLGISLRWQGDLTNALQTLSQAVAEGKRAGDSNMIFAATYLGQTHYLRGHLGRAAAVFQDALQFAAQNTGQDRWQPPLTGLAHAHLSKVLLEWNDLDGALNHARLGYDILERWGNVQTLFDSCFFLSTVLRARRDYSSAARIVAQAWQIAAAIPSPWVEKDAAEIDARLRLAQGDIVGAAQLFRNLRILVGDDFTYQELKYYLVLARICLAEGALQQAIDLLARILAITGTALALSEHIEGLALLALTRYRQGHKEQALEALSQALSLAHSESYLRTFLDEGQPMVDLLRSLLIQGIQTAYARQLLVALEAELSQAEIPPAERLSQREQQVLRLLAAGLSSTEIASELVIAVSTARTHIKHIYRKLEVHDRAEAVKRAAELGLL